MITLYGSPRTSAGRCYWCLEELGLTYETKKINFQVQEHKSPEYLRINPNGKVPALQDGETTIWESMAINFYLADKYQPEFLGTTPMAKAAVYQWSFWSIGELQPPLIEAFIQKVFVPDERRDHGLIERSLKKVPPLLEILNQSLQGKKFLAGDTFTLGDLNTFSVVSICKALQVDLSPYTQVNEWGMRITERAAYRKYQEMCR